MKPKDPAFFVTLPVSDVVTDVERDSVEGYDSSEKMFGVEEVADKCDGDENSADVYEK